MGNYPWPMMQMLKAIGNTVAQNKSFEQQPTVCVPIEKNIFNIIRNLIPYPALHQRYQIPDYRENLKLSGLEKNRTNKEDQ